jgi:hypothetical protein
MTILLSLFRDYAYYRMGWRDGFVIGLFVGGFVAIAALVVSLLYMGRLPWQ